MSLRIFFLGVVVYISKDLFFYFGRKWYEELEDRENFSQRVDVLRKNFWLGFLVSASVVAASSGYMVLSSQLKFNDDLIMRLCAIVIALTASLGRGGWRILSYGNNTVVERIDRGVFFLSQVGATILLLLSLSL